MRDIAFLSNGDAVAALRDGRIMKSTDRGVTWDAVADLARGGWTHGLMSLEPGDDDSLWGLVVPPPSIYDVFPGPIVVSRDGGATFASVGFGVASLLPRLADDPLVLELNGQLWYLPDGSPLAKASFENFGVPNPGGNGQSGSVCGEKIFVASGRIWPLRETLWTSSTESPDWSRGIEVGAHVEFACSSDGNVWAVNQGGIAYVYDPSLERWSDAIDLGTHSADPIYLVFDSVAGPDGKLFALARDSAMRFVVLAATPEGTVRELPALPPGSYRGLKSSSDGILWVFGDNILSFDSTFETWQQRWPQ